MAFSEATRRGNCFHAVACQLGGQDGRTLFCLTVASNLDDYPNRQQTARVEATVVDVLAPRYKAEADARAQALAPTLRELQAKGLTLRGMAAELQKRKVPAPKGTRWHAKAVSRFLHRLDG